MAKHFLQFNESKAEVLIIGPESFTHGVAYFLGLQVFTHMQEIWVYLFLNTLK